MSASSACSAGPPPVPSCCAAVGMMMLMADSSRREPLVWLAVELNFWVLYLDGQCMRACLIDCLKIVCMNA